jgi:hypothetical protein
LFDEHCLMLAVLYSGNKVWRLAYRDEAGKQKTVVVGPCPPNSLKKGAGTPLRTAVEVGRWG